MHRHSRLIESLIGLSCIDSWSVCCTSLVNRGWPLFHFCREVTFWRIFRRDSLFGHSFGLPRAKIPCSSSYRTCTGLLWISCAHLRSNGHLQIVELTLCHHPCLNLVEEEISPSGDEGEESNLKFGFQNLKPGYLADHWSEPPPWRYLKLNGRLNFQQEDYLTGYFENFSYLSSPTRKLSH